MTAQTAVATDAERAAAHLEDLARWLHGYYGWHGAPAWDRLGAVQQRAWLARADEEHLIMHPHCLADAIYHAEESPDAP